MKEENKKKMIEKMLITAFSILATFLILFGIYHFYFSNPKRIMSNAVLKLSNRFEQIFDKNSMDVADNYTIKGNVKINIESELLNNAALSSTKETKEMLAYVKLFQNLSKLDNNYTFIQDAKNKQLFFQLNSNLEKNNIITAKYILQDKKQYILIKNFFNHYVDGGEFDYFKMLEENENQLENWKYIYNVMIQSFNRNLKESYFKVSDVKENINGKEKKVKKISCTIDKDNIIEFTQNILKDLKEDQKANKILTNINSDFKNAKIDKDSFVLEDDEKITLSVYTNSLTYEELKYDIRFQADKDDITISYTDSKEETVEVLNKNKLLLQANIKSDNAKTEIVFKDSKKKELGTLKIVAANQKMELEAVGNYEGINFKVAMFNQNTTAKNGYDIDGNIILKVDADGNSLLNLKITNKASLTKEADIKEKVVNSSNELTPQEQENLQIEFYRILTTLMK